MMTNNKRLKIVSVLAMVLLLLVQTSQAQAVKKGDMTIGGFYGSPSIGTLLLKVFISSTNAEFGNSVDFSYLGPLGGKFEYFVTDDFGIGLEASYSTLSIKLNEGNRFDTYSLTKIRVMPRFTYHMSYGDNLDFFLAGGMGYRTSELGFKSTLITEVIDLEIEEALTNVLPLSLRLAFGGSFFMTENLALTGELGFGGGYLFMGGITFKLPTSNSGSTKEVVE